MDHLAPVVGRCFSCLCKPNPRLINGMDIASGFRIFLVRLWRLRFWDVTFNYLLCSILTFLHHEVNYASKQKTLHACGLDIPNPQNETVIPPVKENLVMPLCFTVWYP